jgi:hypothetical protein
MYTPPLRVPALTYAGIVLYAVLNNRVDLELFLLQ